MKSWLKDLTNGIPKNKVKFPKIIQALEENYLLEHSKSFTKLKHGYFFGIVDIPNSNRAFLEPIGLNVRDFAVDTRDLDNAFDGDIVVAKRLKTTYGRDRAKVLFVIHREKKFVICYTKKSAKNTKIFDFKTSRVIELGIKKKSLNTLPDYTIIKVDINKLKIEEIMGHLDDPSIDEKISLALFDKKEDFSAETMQYIDSFGDIVDKSLYHGRIDLTSLDFCTIDPDDAKDFDDAIYFDKNSFELFVSIADVSSYVNEYTSLDDEAKSRGFTIYFPHKSIPMLPRKLSENLCSLKPNEDRLAFTFKIKLNKKNYAVEKYELFESIINSKKRFTYTQIDEMLAGNIDGEIDQKIADFLLPLYEILKVIRSQRLKKGFDFDSHELKIVLDANGEIESSHYSKDTASHQLIEDCMLLANVSSAKMIKYGIFRTHERMNPKNISKLLSSLMEFGIFENYTADIHETILSIQKQSIELGIKSEVDRLIIKAQEKARYSTNKQIHYGLGFDEYSHFTSPIRRYSDLILHRLLKSRNNEKKMKFLLKDIEQTCENINKLEEEVDRVVWNFVDRKHARWAKKNINQTFDAVVYAKDEYKTFAIIDSEVSGARVFLDYDSSLKMYQKIKVKITNVEIVKGRISGEVIYLEP